MQKEDYRSRVFHPEDLERQCEQRREALTHAVPFELEHRALGRDGKYRWFFVRYKPLLDEQGQIVRWYVVGSDIDERKQAEEKFRRSEAYLAEAQRLSHKGSFGWKPDTGEIVWSNETYRIFEYIRAEKPTLEKVFERIHPEDEPVARQIVDGVHTNGKDFEHECRLLLPGGTVKHIHVRAHALRDSSGKIEFVGAVTDITERKLAEESLRRSEERFPALT